MWERFYDLIKVAQSREFEKTLYKFITCSNLYEAQSVIVKNSYAQFKKKKNLVIILCFYHLIYELHNSKSFILSFFLTFNIMNIWGGAVRQ